MIEKAIKALNPSDMAMYNCVVTTIAEGLRGSVGCCELKFNPDL